MTDVWGYRLPRTPTLKSFRTAYRAANRKFIVNDVSYYGTIELVGSRDDLVKTLGRVLVGRFAGSKYVSCKLGRRTTLMARYESGARAAQTTLYHDQVYPYGLIGPAEVIWRPEEDHLTERTIWLRIHPSIHAETTNLLESLLAAAAGQSSVASTSTAPRQSAIRMTDLRDQIDSFEIMGPKSTSILRRILRLSKTEGKDKANVSYYVAISAWLIFSVLREFKVNASV